MLRFAVLLLLGCSLCMPLSQPAESRDEMPKLISPSISSQEPVVKTWHHDCSNTSGFECMKIPTGSWSYGWTYTDVDLESDGQSFLMPSMTNTSPVDPYYYPAYVYTLPDVFPLSGLRNFSVHMELNNSDPAYCGVVRVGLFDGLYTPVLMAKIDDSFGDEPRGGCRWNYYLQQEDVYIITCKKKPHFDMGYIHRPMDFVNMTWSSWVDPSHGLNGSIPSYVPTPAWNGTIIPIEDVEAARGIRYLVLMFGGYYRYEPPSPFRVHDIFLEYELGGDIDTTPPLLTPQLDITYVVGQTGNTIEWRCTDDYPYRYWLLDYEFYYWSPSTNRIEDLWNGSDYTVCVDGLDVGRRTFLLVLQDKAGFMVWDEVTVVVIEHPFISFLRSNALVIGTASILTLACFIFCWLDRRTPLAMKKPISTQAPV